jgi:hypothetical protein
MRSFLFGYWRASPIGGATAAEHTSGTRESILHLLMFTEGGIALLAGLFLEINAAILLLFFALLVLHEFTGIWDLEYADDYAITSFLTLSRSPVSGYSAAKLPA